MRILKMLGLAIISVVVGVYIYAQIDQQDSESRGATAASAAQRWNAPAYKTTAKTLYNDYETNEVATDQKIGGAPVEISGTVASIDKDFTDAAVVRLMTGNEFQPASLTLMNSDKAIAASLAKGQKVVIRCDKMSRIVGSPAGLDCRIL